MLIRNYSVGWKDDFENLRLSLSAALDGLATSIEHVGSTAVPGLAAKPVIDVDVVYHHDVSFDEVKESLEQIGYYHNGNQGIEGREAFKRAMNRSDHKILDRIQHHLYVCEENSAELKRHLLFRDYLTKHLESREEYQQLKLDIATLANQDRKLYALLKESGARTFIDNIIEKAELEIRNGI